MPQSQTVPVVGTMPAIPVVPVKNGNGEHALVPPAQTHEELCAALAKLCEEHADRCFLLDYLPKRRHVMETLMQVFPLGVFRKTDALGEPSHLLVLGVYCDRDWRHPRAIVIFCGADQVPLPGARRHYWEVFGEGEALFNPKLRRHEDQPFQFVEHARILSEL